MNATFIQRQVPNQLKGCPLAPFIIFVLLLLFQSHASKAQLSGPYSPFNLDATKVDTAEVSMCRLPLHITDKSPSAYEKVKWKVIKGEAKFTNDSTSSLDITDMKIDTCVLTYTTFDINKNVKEVDTLVLANKFFPSCEVIDKGINPGNITCGTVITLNSKLAYGYTYNWFSASPTVQIINQNPFSGTVQFKALAAGYYNIVVTARSPMGWNVLIDSYSFTVTCNPTVTQANAGPDANVYACQFPYTLNGNLPAVGETVKWEVVSGAANIQNATSPNATITDASYGTQLKYTISNGTQSSSDDMTFFVNSNYSSLCDPIITNTNPSCGQSVSINFNWVVNSGYIFQWTLPAGLTATGSLTNSAIVTASQAGTYQVLVKIKTPQSLNTITKIITLNVTCVIPVTAANAGLDQSISSCQFPYTIFGNMPKSTESAKWEVVPGTGSASFLSSTGNALMLIDATDGVQLKYTISNGSQSSSDITIVNVNRFNTLFCDPTISSTSPKCGDTVTIKFDRITSSNYSFNWNYSSSLMPLGTLKSTGKFKVMTSGTLMVSITITSPSFYNVVTKTVYLNAICSTPITHANAGSDATAYCSSFHLSGNNPGVNETSEWRIIEGVAKLEDKNKPTSLIYDIESTKLKLVYTISNGTLSSSDTLAITSNPLKIAITDIKDTDCGKNNGSAKVQVSGGLAPYQIAWQGTIQGSELTNVPAGAYHVRVNDQSGCTAKDSVQIKDNCSTSQLCTVEGHVYGGKQLLPFGLAMLLSNSNGTATPVNTTNVVNGYYKFEGVTKGDYIVYVLPYKDRTTMQLHDKFLPTYYVNKTNIQYANPIHVIGNTYSVDITLAEKAPTNIGSIQLTIIIKTNSCIALLPVLLFNDKNELVSYGYYNGTSCHFNNISSGKYYICMASNVGYAQSQLFEVSENEFDKEVSLDAGKVMSTLDAKDLVLNAYPNPFNNDLFLELQNLNDDVKISVIEGITGREINEVGGSRINDLYHLNTESLPSGLYLLKVLNGDKQISIPIIKK